MGCICAGGAGSQGAFPIQMEVQAQEVAILQLLERRQAPAAQPDHAVLLSNAVPHLWAEQVLLALALAAASPDDTCSLCRTSVSAAACIGGQDPANNQWHRQ